MPRHAAKANTKEPSMLPSVSSSTEPCTEAIQSKIKRSESVAEKKAKAEIKANNPDKNVKMLAEFIMDLDKLLKQYPSLQFIGAWGVHHIDKEIDGISILSGLLRRGDTLTHKLLLEGLGANIYRR